jgi:hypothetical protein
MCMLSGSVATKIVWDGYLEVRRQFQDQLEQHYF